MINRWIIAIGLVLASFALYAQPVPVDVEILALNDFHGNLRPPGTLTIADPADPTKTTRVEAGGAEYLATQIRTLRAKNPNNILVAAGDLIGATPLLSSLFHDEPTVEAMNMMGLDFSAVGNHEFDKGRDELLRMQNGSAGFEGAKFKYLAANVVDTKTGKTLFPAYQIHSFGGIPVAFIGLTLKDAPTLVSAKGIAGLEFRDEADTVNRLVPELRAQGVEAIVVLIHEGGVQHGDYNDCKDMSGAIIGIVNRFDKAVDVVISGHTHAPYNCMINGKLVTSASSFGRVLTEIDIRLDPDTHDVIAKKAENLVVRHDIPMDANQTSLIQRIAPLVAPLETRVVGSVTAALHTDTNPAGESSLGDIIADAQLEATRDASGGEAQIAFMNSGGIRADIRPDDGRVTYGQIFNVQPFGDNIVTMSILGSEIHDLLEQQWSGGNQGTADVLQVSAGFTYTWDAAKPAGQRVDPASIRLNGTAVVPARSYRIAVSDYLAAGGNNFTVLIGGKNVVGVMLDLDILERYFKAHSPVSPVTQDRIRRRN